MARKRKKGRKPNAKQPAGQQRQQQQQERQQQQQQQQQQPRHMREVVDSAMLINMLEKATAADQIIQLQQRVGCLQTEREQLRQRAAESEDQRDAVFNSLKQTVVDAQTEIQVKCDIFRSECTACYLLVLIQCIKKAIADSSTRIIRRSMHWSHRPVFFTHLLVEQKRPTDGATLTLSY